MRIPPVPIPGKEDGASGSGETGSNGESMGRFTVNIEMGEDGSLDELRVRVEIEDAPAA